MKHELESSDARLRTVFAAMSEGLVIHDRDGRIVDANAAAAPILGLTRDQLLGRTSIDPRWEAVREDGTPWPGEAHPGMVALRTGRELRLQFMGITAPGLGRRWISINASPLWEDGPGKPSGSVASFNDVTPRLELKAELERVGTELLDLYDNAPCGYHSLDANGRYIRINATELGWLGCTREEVLGRLSPADFFTDEGRARFDANFPRLLAGEAIEALEFDLIGRDRSRRRVSVNATAIRRSDGSVVATRSVLHDITARQQAEELRGRALELESQNSTLEASARLKNELLTTLSHELRTPLNAVLGFTHLLRSGTVAPDSPRYGPTLDKIDRSSRELLRLIESMLTFMQVESGQIAVSPEPVGVGGAVDDVLALLRPACDARGIRAVARIEPGLAPLHVDPLRLRQVLAALVDNAIKFSHESGEVEVRAHDDAAGHVVFVVEDHGIGIAAADLPHLFSPLRQLSTGNARTHGGIGIGLALTRRLVQAMCGTVGARSVPGQGSVFTVTLPRAESLSRSAPPDSAAPPT